MGNKSKKRKNGVNQNWSKTHKYDSKVVAERTLEGIRRNNQNKVFKKVPIIKGYREVQVCPECDSENFILLDNHIKECCDCGKKYY